MKKLNHLTNFSKEKYLREYRNNINGIKKRLSEKYKPIRANLNIDSENRNSGQRKAA